MQFQTDNNVKIYNLSCGKSLPDWLSERKRRLLQKKNVDIRRRIELIQDFEMPGVSTGIKMSRDGNFIFATGVYKPRIRCYDVNNLSMKFERCFDAEAVQFELLSDDYKKFALLQCNRTIELHVQHGSYFKLRIPKFGRDLKYHKASCDLLTCGAGSEIYRLNLEQGRFLYPYHTEASSLNKLAIHEYYDIIACGTMEGKVEAWDPRQRERIATLDCALAVPDYQNIEGFPSVTALSFKGDLTMAVGTFTGQVMLYDIRANKPFLVQTHESGQPVKCIEFVQHEELIVSMNPNSVRFWKKNTTVGPAPKWCCFLDNITEELEESKQDAVYDDYKFVTQKELEQLHLDHLIGTNLLRGYMHGYFMDVRLYNKARAIVQPEAYQDLKKKMIQSKIEKERSAKRIQVKQLPSINKDYAQKLLEKKTNNKEEVVTPFEDDRFKDLFENPDFEIKQTDEEYARIKATVERANKKKVTIVPESEPMDLYQEDNHKSSSSSESEDEEEESEDSDVELPADKKRRGMLKAVDSERFKLLYKNDENEDESIPVEERLKQTHESFKESTAAAGNKVVTWTTGKPEKASKREEERKAHMKERAKCRRPANKLLATDVGLETIMSENNFGDLWILTDSHSSIQHLKNWTYIGDKTSLSILQKLKFISVQHDVHFQWTPSHVDIHGNELADNLAKEGSSHPIPFSSEITFLELFSRGKKPKTRRSGWCLLHTTGTKEESRDFPYPFHATGQSSTCLSRHAIGHLKCRTYSEGNKICPKCHQHQVSPKHILDCLELDWEEIYSSPLLVIDFIKVNRFLDLV
ncbi:Nucleolar protein 10 [Araneus ventricosus]|uniref:Nucleolar protein 10 n=1 Tax=Araneus ventricosus TaxID=182803 RepID=A0A4Y2CWM6_ARAVE|nr:Nucleolar protein 10 [Araneus ventricosus]